MKDNNRTLQHVVIGDGVGFERIRRITGYLVGTMNKWNDAKKAEENERVKHGRVIRSER
jgi:ribonucleoside-triphosphate reductase